MELMLLVNLLSDDEELCNLVVDKLERQPAPCNEAMRVELCLNPSLMKSFVVPAFKRLVEDWAELCLLVDTKTADFEFTKRFIYYTMAPDRLTEFESTIYATVAATNHGFNSEPYGPLRADILLKTQETFLQIQREGFSGETQPPVGPAVYDSLEKVGHLAGWLVREIQVLRRFNRASVRGGHLRTIGMRLGNTDGFAKNDVECDRGGLMKASSGVLDFVRSVLVELSKLVSVERVGWHGHVREGYGGVFVEALATIRKLPVLVRKWEKLCEECAGDIASGKDIAYLFEFAIVKLFHVRAGEFCAAQKDLQVCRGGGTRNTSGIREQLKNARPV
jgi:hypothetical protein